MPYTRHVVIVPLPEGNYAREQRIKMFVAEAKDVGGNVRRSDPFPRDKVAVVSVDFPTEIVPTRFATLMEQTGSTLIECHPA